MLNKGRIQGSNRGPIEVFIYPPDPSKHWNPPAPAENLRFADLETKNTTQSEKSLIQCVGEIEKKKEKKVLVAVAVRVRRNVPRHQQRRHRMLSGCAICVQTETLRSKWTRASLRGRACEEVRGVDSVSGLPWLKNLIKVKIKAAKMEIWSGIRI